MCFITAVVLLVIFHILPAHRSVSRGSGETFLGWMVWQGFCDELGSFRSMRFMWPDTVLFASLPAFCLLGLVSVFLFLGMALIGCGMRVGRTRSP
jgi:hypothetical protein